MGRDTERGVGTEPMENKEFEAIYRENAAIVLRYLLHMGCSPEDAEDLVQDTFVKALLSIDSFRGGCKLSVWLCQIAKHKFYDLLRKRKQEPVSRGTDLSSGDDSAYFEWLELIERLAEPYRTVFKKRELEGYGYAEVARLFGRTENWARVTFFRARTKLQNMAADC